MKSDAQVQQDVINELRWDTHVSATDVGVEVDQGVVTLTGTVDSFAKKMAAQEAAHRVVGVLDVANDIQVRVPGSAGRTDTDVALAVRRTLEWDALVPDERIQTTVMSGWVTLDGQVNAWAHRQEAERVVRGLAGVVGVVNNLRVHAADIEPWRVRDAIEEALARRAEREAERIQVSVQDGTVTITGRVRSWAERRAVVGAAGHAPGVQHIDDQLVIDPYA
ncbi:MAG: BON domain-containing protein [Dehalococcoidia bacterium]